MSYSTRTLSAAIVVYGAAVLIEAPGENWPASLAFVLSGLLGLGVTPAAQRAYRARRNAFRGIRSA